MEAADLPMPDMLKSLRAAVRMSQAQLAQQLCTITGTTTLTRHEVSRWEQGKVRPVAWLPSLAEALDVDIGVLEDAPPRAPAPGYSPGGRSDEWEQAEELLRRSFLARGVAATAVSVWNPTSGPSRVLQTLAVLGADRSSEIVDSFGELVDHYGVAACALPPTDVYDELLPLRAYASQLLDQFAGSRHSELVVAVGWLSNLLAVVSSDMGEHATARLWCADAERRAQETRHPELQAWALLTKSLVAMYQGEPRQAVTLAAKGRDAVRIGSVAYAKLTTQEMRAAALAGDARRMGNVRRRATTAIERLPTDAPETGTWSIAVGEDPPYTATSLLYLGRYREASAATERVITSVYRPEARQRGEHPSGYARSLLIMGLAQAGVGDLDEAVSAGYKALAGSRPVWPTMVLAGRLESALTKRFQGSKQVGEYSARYREAAQPLRVPALALLTKDQTE